MIAVVILLSLLAALLGLREGLRILRLDEGAVIEAFAERYVAEAGAAARTTDCVGTPGRTEGAWIAVVCDGDGATWRYDVARSGRLIARTVSPEGT